MSLVKAGIHYNYEDNEPKLVLHYRTHEDESAPCVNTTGLHNTRLDLHIDSDPSPILATLSDSIKVQPEYTQKQYWLSR